MNKSVNKVQVIIEKNKVVEKKRLPCRGCTKACKYLIVCEGKPWRTLQNAVTE
jgi:hypothetical protein